MKKKPTPLRRRSRPSWGERLRMYWVLVLLLAFALAYGGWVLARAPFFRVIRVDVVGGHRVAPAVVARRAAIGVRSSIWLLDVSAIARRVEAIPYVATARIHRSLPATVRIEIVERVADGCVRTDDGAELTVDREQRVLERGCAPDAIVYLPRNVDDAAPGTFLGDADLARLQADARTLRHASERLTDFSHDRYGGLEAKLGDGIRVRFGDESNLELKRRLLGPILASLGERLGGVSAIDLRAPTTPVVERR
jgi:cell division protein FtsQ